MDKSANCDYLAHLIEQLSSKGSLVSVKSLDKFEAILKVISAPAIDLNKLQTLCFTGIPDEFDGLRALCWKILLKYLPNTRSKWHISLDSDRKNYEYYKGIFLKPNTKVPPPEIIKQHQQNLYLEEEAARKLRLIKKKNGNESKDTNKNNNNESIPKNESMSASADLSKNGLISQQANVQKNNRKNDLINNYDSESTNTWKKSTIEVGQDVDHPLSTSKTSEWNTYFKDMALWDEIEKDTKRTRNELDFFQKTTNNLVGFTYSKTAKKTGFETHVDVISRILFIYGKLNPGIGYIQGMNEILAPLYYCFCNDKNPCFNEYAEADAFYCFSKLMEDEVKDSFLKNLDHTTYGIQARIKYLNELLKKVDKQIWAHLEKHSVNPQFYSLRWLLLLLTQEFELMDVLKLWDTLLSHTNKIDFLYYICLSIILGARDSIMIDDFSVIMETLQKHSTQNLDKILTTSVRLYKQYGKPEDLNQMIFQEKFS